MAIGRPRRRRLALLICNGHYTRVPEFQLAGPAEDARRFAAVLSNPESCRFDVRVLVDRGLLEVRREIARICREADAEDTILIYYSGNGLRDEFGNLYLAVVDVDQDFIDATALDTEFITLQLRRSRCRRTSISRPAPRCLYLFIAAPQSFRSQSGLSQWPVRLISGRTPGALGVVGVVPTPRLSR